MPVRVFVTQDITACQRIRRKVFIEEQGVAEDIEMDGLDHTAVHLLAQDGGRMLGTARLVISGETGKIGRVAVLPENRGQGLGKALMLKALEELSTRGVKTAKLGSQKHAVGFYQALGFAVVGPEYMEAGIAHRTMVISL